VFDSRERDVMVGFTRACAEPTHPYWHIATSTTAYPRVRGDDQIPFEERPTCTGLPARARRRRSNRLGYHRSRGLPARGAEKTQRTACRHHDSSVYPRERGDDERATEMVPGPSGLPARARRRPFMKNAENIHQFWSARRYRGSRCVSSADEPGRVARTRISESLTEAVYPRERGEDPSAIHSSTGAFGLPARARRRPERNTLLNWSIRFTRACAEQTTCPVALVG
jgi:hypothetical protein